MLSIWRQQSFATDNPTGLQLKTVFYRIRGGLLIFLNNLLFQIQNIINPPPEDGEMAIENTTGKNTN